MGNVWDAIRKHQDKAPPPDDGPPPQPTQPRTPLPAESGPASTPPAPPSENDPPDSAAPPSQSAPASTTPVADAEALRRQAAPPPTYIDDPTDPSEPGTEPTLPPAPTTTRYHESLVVHHDRGGPAAEEYRALRTSLMATAKNEQLRFAITSAQAGEGKTVTTLNLGLILTERVHQRTLIVDADLRRGCISDLTGLPGQPGFAEVLQGRAELNNCIQPTVYNNLFVLTHGQVPHGEVGQLIGHHQLETAFEQLQKDFDHILVDTPPIGMFSDAGIIGRELGNALLVMRMNKTHKESADRALRLLEASNVQVDGVVLTHRRYHIPNVLYRYA